MKTKARSPLQLKHKTERTDVRENELSTTVRKVMRQYFKDLDGEKPSGIYSMVVSAVERPMLEVVMWLTAQAEEADGGGGAGAGRAHRFAWDEAGPREHHPPEGAGRHPRPP